MNLQTNITYEELIEKLKLVFDKVSDVAHENYNWDTIEENPEYIKAKKAHDDWEALNPRPDYNSKEWLSYTNWADEVYIPWKEKKQAELGEYADTWEFGNKLVLQAAGLGSSMESVESYGGEGMGETWYVVYYFKDLDLYIKVDGFYQSYSGVSFNGWDDISIVRPVEKTVTVYE